MEVLQFSDQEEVGGGGDEGGDGDGLAYEGDEVDADASNAACEEG